MNVTLQRQSCFHLLLLAGLLGGEVARGQTPVLNYTNFTGAGLNLQGGAVETNGRLRLTGPGATPAGGAWFATKRFVAGGFDTTFQFQISDAGGSGDGFAFVIQNNAVPALGTSGGRLGYDGIPNSVVVEFDTIQNTGDPNGNHVSVHTRGVLPNSADHSAALGVATNGLPGLRDGNPHTARLRYAPAGLTPGSLRVYVDDMVTPVLDLPLDLPATLALDNGQAWFGFTAATGGGATHDLLDWSFTTAAFPLTVALVAPADGASYVAPGVIALIAEAVSDEDEVETVEFFLGSRKLGEDLSAPHEFTWNNVAPGVYWLTAVATDASGRISAAPPVKVTVHPATPAIGVNFSSGAGGTGHPLDANEQAGVVPQRFWNNVTASAGGNGSAVNLRNANNSATTVDVSFDFFARGDEPLLNPGLSSNHKLMKAHVVDHAGLSGGQTNGTLTFAQIPFPVYDVLIYSDGANSGADRVAEFRLGGTSLFLRDASWAGFSGVYTEARGGADLGTNTTAGNYVRFSGLTNAAITVTVTARTAGDGMKRAAVNAVQIVPSVYDLNIPPRLTRGPYLQLGTPTSMMVRWRTDRPTDSLVRYGTNLAALTATNLDAAALIDHGITLTGLQPDTLYYYAVGSTETNLSAGSDHYFITSPVVAKPTRVWVIGDAGTAGNGTGLAQSQVRDAYYDYAFSRHTDVWLMLGDNAYNSGTDTEYQRAMFDMYPGLLRRTPAWSTVGNHETAQSHTFNTGIPYYQIFNLPGNAEAGGVASGTERYYSFNYGNIHFVCLDAMTSSRSSTGPMADWLRSDLDANTNEWLIGFWHHPPYTKGSHHSDDPNGPDGADFELVEMRENIVPILESYGVDLVLGGHSHCYERSYLLNGHHSYSSTLTPEMKVDPGTGRPAETGAYRKATAGPDAGKGAVYIVAGSSGQATFVQSDWPHQAMCVSLLQLGSLVLDINGRTLEAKFLRETGDIEDTFTMIKEAPVIAFNVTSLSLTNGRLALVWNAEPGKTYYVERATNLIAPDWTAVSPAIVATNGASAWSQPWDGTPAASYFRIQKSGN